MNKKKVIKAMIVAVPIMVFSILNMQTENSAVASQVRDSNIEILFEHMADCEEELEAEVVPNGKRRRLASEDDLSTELASVEESTEATLDEESSEESSKEDEGEASEESDAAETVDEADGEEDSDAGSSDTGTGSTGSSDIGSTGTGSTGSTDLGTTDGNMGTVGYILIGDSRFVGMDEVVDVDSHANQYIIAKCGAGYDFLVNEALPRAASIEVQHSEVDTWYYIINLGVNDLQSVWKYVGTYRSLVISKNVVIQSVNPIEYTSVAQTNQARIKSFNEKMKLVQGATYLDTYNTLMRNGFSTVDGLHYTEETSDYIYKCIQKCMREIESKS